MPAGLIVPLSLSSCCVVRLHRKQIATNLIIGKRKIAKEQSSLDASNSSILVLSYSISCEPLLGSGCYKGLVQAALLCNDSRVGVTRELTKMIKGINKCRPRPEIKKNKTEKQINETQWWLTRTVSGVVKVMGSATSTAWHIQSGRPAIDSNLLPVRASSKMSRRKESAVNST